LERNKEELEWLKEHKYKELIPKWQIFRQFSNH
jgi:hypothetical protein